MTGPDIESVTFKTRVEAGTGALHYRGSPIREVGQERCAGKSHSAARLCSNE